MFKIKAIYHTIKNDYYWISCTYKELLDYVFNLIWLLLQDTLKLKWEMNK